MLILSILRYGRRVGPISGSFRTGIVQIANCQPQIYNRLMPMPWELPDEKLLAECRVESFVSSGPGGQKRHKTNAAVRITHLPTRICAVETQSRSNRENKIHALRDRKSTRLNSSH